MDRIWQWAWDRYGARYSWAALAAALPASLPIYRLWSCAIVAVEKSHRYLEAVAVTVVAAVVLHGVMVLTNRGFRPAEQWVAGHGVDRAAALEAT
jgi:adenylate cyclase